MKVLQQNHFSFMNQSPNKTALLLWILLTILLVFPLLLSQFPQISGEKLYGVGTIDRHDLSLTWKNISTGKFQDDADRLIRQDIGLSNYWVRLHNEINFRAFRYSNTEKLVLGKNDCFFEEIYITEYLGHNYIGEYFIRKKVANLKRLQELLEKQYNKHLILVFEPGKASFSPEAIPDRYRPEQKGTSNYEGFTRECNRQGVGYLDLNRYFVEQKPLHPHKLYSKYGVHWSSYGLWLAADTLTGFLERTCGIDLPDCLVLGDSNSTRNKDLDFDLEPPMNLLCELPHETMNFPIRTFRYDSTRHARPRAFTIADSYYWSIWNSGIAQNLFSDNTFWYYNRTVYPDIWDPIVWADKSKLKETIERNDIILLMITEANLYDFGWGFVEEALAVLDSTYVPDPEITALNETLGNKETYRALLLRSQREQVPFAELLKPSGK